MNASFPTHFCNKPFGDGIYAFGSHAMQATGNLICPFAKFSAGMEIRQHKLQGWHIVLGVHVHRDAPTIILNRARAIRMEVNGYFRTISGQGFVYRIIDNLKNAMMQAPFVGVPNVHVRSFANTFKTFEFLNFGGIVFFLWLFISSFFFRHLKVFYLIILD